MKQHLEIEFKTMLSEEEFNKLYQTMGFDEGFLQINSYFDTLSTFFLKKRMMLRIRSVNDVFIFTMKTPSELGVLENEFKLDSFNQNDPKIQKILGNFGIESTDLLLVAQSKTIRHEIVDQHGTWCLDLNEFAQDKDYELEYELHEGVNYEDAQQHYFNKINELNILYKEAKPKYIRALSQS